MQPASSERPRFRQDLVAESIEESGVTFVDVMDPDSGNAFRFYEAEFSLACGMDGERDLAGLVRWAQDELGLTPTHGELRSVIETLGELGYLDQPGAARPAAAAPADVPLAAGVVAPRAAAPVPPPRDASRDDELGVPGAGAGRRAAPSMPPAPELELGRPGAGMQARGPAEPASDDLPLGRAGRGAAPTTPPREVGATSDVSLDLSEHMAVGAADVQEAVRQSKVMAAVEVPDDMDLELAPTALAPSPLVPPRAATPTAPSPSPAPTIPSRAPTPVPGFDAPRASFETATPPPPPPPRAATPAPGAVPLAQPLPPPPAVTPSMPVPQPTPASLPPKPPSELIARPIGAHKPPVELPKVPDKQPPAAPAPAARTSPALIAVLVLVVLGAGAFFVWKFVLDKPSEPAPAATAPTPPPPPPEPPKPPAATAKIELTPAKPQTIAATAAAAIEWVEANGKEVAGGDVIAKLKGAKPLEVLADSLRKEADKRNTDLENAKKTAAAAQTDAARKQADARVALLEKAYNDKNEQLAKATSQLEPLLVRSTGPGTLTVGVKVGEKLAADATIATLQPPPETTATFKLPPRAGSAAPGADAKLEPGSTATLQLGDKQVACTIAERTGDTVRVACPKESGVTEGAAVSWQLPQ